MTPRTLPLSAVPDSLGAWDRTARLASEQNAINDPHEEDRRERKQLLQDALEDALSENDVDAPAFFAKPRKNRDTAHSSPFRAPSVGEVLVDALASRKGLQRRLAQLLLDAALGMDVEAQANGLIRDATEEFAENEVDQ